MFIIRYIAFIVGFLCLSCASLLAQEKDQTILQNQPEKPSRQVFQRDTVKVDSLSTTTPGEDRFFPFQDSSYFRALRLKISPFSRFQLDLKQISQLWLEGNIDQAPTATERLYSVMKFPSSLLLPSESDRILYNYGLEQARAIPRALPAQTPGSGVSIPLSAIGAFFGLTEDVSPTMYYTLDMTAQVEIVIYSMQASVVATIMNKTQRPGKYEVTWNGRDDKGRKLPTGDYVGEVRIGRSSIVRKRISI